MMQDDRVRKVRIANGVVGLVRYGKGRGKPIIYALGLLCLQIGLQILDSSRDLQPVPPY